MLQSSAGAHAHRHGRSRCTHCEVVTADYLDPLAIQNNTTRGSDIESDHRRASIHLCPEYWLKSTQDGLTSAVCINNGCFDLSGGFIAFGRRQYLVQLGHLLYTFKFKRFGAKSVCPAPGGRQKLVEC